MKYCNKCFCEQNTCDCISNSFIEIDYLIYPTIYELNRKGYQTTYCCSGHESCTLFNPYIMFNQNDYDIECDEKLFSFEKYRYRGVERKKKEFIRPTKECVKYFSNLKNEEEKKEYIIEFNMSLYYWAKSLPVFIENKQIPFKDFKDEYFVQHRELQSTNPFLLIVNPYEKEWQIYMNSVFEKNRKLYVTGINEKYFYKDVLIDLYKENDLTLSLLSKTCNSLILSKDSSLKSMVINLADDQWHLFSVTKDLHKYEIEDKQSLLNQYYYSGKSLMECLMILIKSCSTLIEHELIILTNNDMNVIVSNKDINLYLYQYEESLLITNSKNDEIKNEFSTLTVKKHTYLIFNQRKLLARGVIV